MIASPFRRRRLRTNVLANATGRLVPGVLTLVSVPVLVAVLGTEAYGLIGFFAVLQMMFGMLDQGLTTTATREVAGNRAEHLEPRVSQTLVRSLEAVYWAVAIAIGFTIAGGSGWLATRWLNTSELPSSDVRVALVASGIAIAARWPASLYRGVLDGLELQVTQNVIAIAAAIARILGGIVVVLAIEPSVTAYMAWQAIVASAEVAVVCAVAWAALGGGVLRSRIDGSALRRVWRYAAALNIVGALALVMANIDRIVISNLLPLEQLGYYTIALTAASLIPHLAAAVSVAILPRFAGAAARGDSAAIRGTYRQATGVVAYVTVGSALTLAFFSSEVLRLWLPSGGAVEGAAVVLALLGLAYLFNALYTVPYTLAVATGHARVPLMANVVGAPLLAAVMIPVVARWGIIGAASASLGLMVAFFVWYLESAHRVVLPGATRGIFASSVLPYAIVGVAVLGGARLAASALGSNGAHLMLVAGVLVYAYAGSTLLPAGLPRLRIRRPKLS